METAFGPADHPDLPLGLRRHPRYALRFCAGTIETIYAHDRATIDFIRPRLPAGSIIELWTGERWEEIA